MATGSTVNEHRLRYDLTITPKFIRDFGLRDQITRASGSTMHNIAEGFDGGTNMEFVKFLRHAQRSCTEVQSQLYIALDRKYINSDQFQNAYDLAGQTHAKVGGFIRYLLSVEPARNRAKPTIIKTKNQELRTER